MSESHSRTVRSSCGERSAVDFLPTRATPLRPVRNLFPWEGGIPTDFASFGSTSLETFQRSAMLRCTKCAPIINRVPTMRLPVRRAFSTLQIGLARALQDGSQALGPGRPRSGPGVRGVRGVRHMASNSGYDAQFVDLPDHLTCPICCTGLKAPQLTHCGHRFCKPCLEVVRRKDRSLACPVCREELTSNQVYPDNACKRDVLNLQRPA